MIVWLASYPRSGNTLLRMLLYYYCGVHTYSMHGDGEFVRDGFAQLIGHMGQPPYGVRDDDVAGLVGSPITYFVKTHVECPDDLPADGKIVHIVRDGRDALVSQCRRRSRPKVRSYPDELWDRVTHDYWQRFVLAWLDVADIHVRYEDLLVDGLEQVRTLVSVLDLDVPLDENADPPMFGTLHDLSNTFFRRGFAGSHWDEMTNTFRGVFMQHNGAGMEAYGYS